MNFNLLLFWALKHVIDLYTCYKYCGTFGYRTTAGHFKVYFDLKNFHLTTRLRWPQYYPLLLGYMTLDSKRCEKKLFKEAIDQYIQDMRQLFQVWHNLCSELTSMWTFKMYSRNAKTNEPTASNNKSDRPQVNIWDNWKSLKYLNINDSIHLKDLDISKYKRESKARMPIKLCCLFFVHCGLFSFLNINKVKI
jgi:hypothetical protein